MTGVVDRLQCHPAGQGSIPDHSDALEILTTVVSGKGHAQGRGNRCTGVPSTEVVEGTFATFEITGDTILLSEGVEVVEATGDQLVRVGLVAHIPDDPISVEIQGLIKSQRQLDNAEAWTQMSTTGGHNLQMAFTDLPSHIGQFGVAETVQLIGMCQITETHAQPAPVLAIYGVRSKDRGPGELVRMAR